MIKDGKLAIVTAEIMHAREITPTEQMPAISVQQLINKGLEEWEIRRAFEKLESGKYITIKYGLGKPSPPWKPEYEGLIVIELHDSFAELSPKNPHNTLPAVEKPGIDGLYRLGLEPTTVFYEGADKAQHGSVTTEGKTQPFAILALAAEKYQRQLRTRSARPKSIKLSLAEIEQALRDPKLCNRFPSWEAIRDEKRRVSSLLQNIRRIIPLTNDEITVESVNDSAYLVFLPPHK